MFIHLKFARDTIISPSKRFAYDRFGPESTKWQHCSTIYDFVITGFQQIVTYYIASGLFMFVMGMLGYVRKGAYVCQKLQSLRHNVKLTTIIHSGATSPSAPSSSLNATLSQDRITLQFSHKSLILYSRFLKFTLRIFRFRLLLLPVRLPLLFFSPCRSSVQSLVIHRTKALS